MRPTNLPPVTLADLAESLADLTAELREDNDRAEAAEFYRDVVLEDQPLPVKVAA